MQRWRFSVPCAALLLAVGACGNDGASVSAATTSSSSSGGSSTSSTTGAASTTGGAADTTTGGGVDEDAIVRYCGDDSAAIEARITDVLAALDVPAKVAMMHGVGLLPTAGAWAVAGNVEQGIPGLHMLDGPRGVSKVSGETATVFPVGMMRGATWDPALEREVGAAMGREVRSVGADVLLAPTMNLLRHPRWGRAQETYGEDTAHVGAMASAFIEGVQSELSLIHI